MLPRWLAKLRYSAKQVGNVSWFKNNQRTCIEVLGETTCNDFFAMLRIIDCALEPLHPDITFIARGGGPSCKIQLTLASTGKERKRLPTSGQVVIARVVQVVQQIAGKREKGEQQAVLVPSKNAR